MEQATLQTVTEKIQPVIIELGFELVEIKFEKEYGTDTLTVFIYKKGGVRLEDCELVSEKLNPVLDATDFCSGAYNFNVSSPGLDRPIVSDDDYRRNLGEEIEIIWKKPVGKKKGEHGILTEYSESDFVLKTATGKEIRFEKESAAVVRPYIRF